MRRLAWFCLVLLMVVPAISFAGDVQVLCEPGLQVFLDGKLTGVSVAKDEGLFLSNVRVGTHVVRVEKQGFLPQSFEIIVQKLPVEVKVGEFSPEPTAAPEKATESAKVTSAGGTLLITSAPQNCIVELDGKSEVKSIPILWIQGLAEGEHTISFSKSGYQTVTGQVRVDPGADVTVRGDLVSGKVETVQEGMGSIRVTSTPTSIKVRLLGKTYDKTQGTLNVTHLSAGAHKIEAIWSGHELSSTVVIAKGQRALVNVSFIKGDQPFTVSYEPE